MLFGISTLHRFGFIPSTVLDVGASDGRWSELAMKFFPNARYILFEPQSCHSSGLLSFKERYPETVTVINKAVGLKSGTSYFDAKDPFGGALHSAPGDDIISVQVMSLDEAVADLKLTPPYLIKLDTHGYERSIFDGSKSALQGASALVIEAYNYKLVDECMLFWELCTYLQNLNFRPIAMADISNRPYDRTLWQMDIFFVNGSWPGFSYVSFV
jgi:FkbM family methyltransferase